MISKTPTGRVYGPVNNSAKIICRIYFIWHGTFFSFRFSGYSERVSDQLRIGLKFLTNFPKFSDVTVTGYHSFCDAHKQFTSEKCFYLIHYKLKTFDSIRFGMPFIVYIFIHYNNNGCTHCIRCTEYACVPCSLGSFKFCLVRCSHTIHRNDSRNIATVNERCMNLCRC